MNTSTHSRQTVQTAARTGAATPAGAQTAPATAVRREHRTRDYGVGYGSSSGYASARRYADNWGNARFVCG